MLSYYGVSGVREICHDVKMCNKDAVFTMAEYFSNLGILDRESIIIPAPQHYGYADYTLQIAELVSKSTGVKILDILKCNPRDKLYDLKREHKPKSPGLYLSESVKVKGKLFFLDNVIASGATYCEACKVIGCRLNPLVYAIDDTLKGNEKYV